MQHERPSCKRDLLFCLMSLYHTSLKLKLYIGKCLIKNFHSQPCYGQYISVFQCQIIMTQTVTPFSWMGNINQARCQPKVNSIICYVKRPHINNINTRSQRSAQELFEKYGRIVTWIITQCNNMAPTLMMYWCDPLMWSRCDEVELPSLEKVL